MGQACSTSEAAYDDGKELEYLRQSTIHDLENENDVSGYSVGYGIDALIRDYNGYIAKTNNQDPKKSFELMVKHNLSLHFLSTMVFVCKGDGILGKKEEEYVLSLCEKWHITNENVINEALKGKNCAKQLSKAVNDWFKELSPDADDETVDIMIDNCLRCMVMQCVIAATQDGLVKQEYHRIKLFCKELGFDESLAQQCVDIIKQEKLLYSKMSTAFNFVPRR